MSNELIIAIISLIGTAGGSIFGVLKANKLTNFRISQLEKKVDKHNHLAERMIAVEQSVKSAHKRIEDLSEEVKNRD